MQNIDLIYNNPFGIAFYWKEESITCYSKIQLIFRDIGFLITKEELHLFSKSIKKTMASCSLCECCSEKESCRALLLNTPAKQVSLAVSLKELKDIQDLVDGTLFQINLEGYIKDMTSN